MQVRNALTIVVWRAAVSVIAGLLVSAFAAAALALGSGAAERLAAGRTISDPLAPLLSAVARAGLIASVVVFACLFANDVVRAAGRWLVAQRRWFILLFQAIRWLGAQMAWLVGHIALAVVVALQFVVRSTVVVEAVWVVRTVGWPVVLTLGYVAVVGLCAIVYVGIIVSGFGCIDWSTHILVTMLDDPPRPLAMALGFGGVAVLMYIGIAALALVVWVTYQAARAGAGLVRRVGTVAS